MQQIREVVAESKLPNKNDELLLINSYIAVISKEPEKLDKKVIDEMKEKVFNISNFDEEGLITYCNFMIFLVWILTYCYLKNSKAIYRNKQHKETKDSFGNYY
ncbi:hypothetical protein [Lactobacillus sp.]|uniref:hypothetical protein n=1 Tax=Lactobacillus sp. TaxID=1591 RepID=UPI0025CBA290|nr:hypothetical protein [Lactobacillus sp.]MCO6534103.1 hypothetical protein [Lactobacillus sp.]